MPFSRREPDLRRKIFLALSGSIEGQLRDLFAKKNIDGKLTQADVAQKIGVNRSVVNRRLSGGSNMRTETIADMVWALGGRIKVEIYDPEDRPEDNDEIAQSSMSNVEAAAQIATAANLSNSNAYYGNVVTGSNQYGSAELIGD